MKYTKFKYLFLRRVMQILILVFFVLGNYSIATLKNVQSKEQRGVFGGNIESFIGDSSSIVAKEQSALSLSLIHI